jgi:nucleoside-triphosphatase
MEGILAREGLPSPSRVSRYGINQEDMEEVGARSLEEGLRGFPLVVIDEIGNMEVVSLRFQQAVIACLESVTPVLGVIKAGEGPFVSRIKQRDDVEIIELTRDVRAAVKARVKAWLRARFPT